MAAVEPLRRSVFVIPGMDCAAEERLVRLVLEGGGDVERLSFDLVGRRLTVWHGGEATTLEARLRPMGLGARLIETGIAADNAAATGARVARDVRTEPAGDAADADSVRTESKATDASETATLRLLLGINAVMFVVELLAGWLAQSAGLLADSLDMFADAAVYALSLYAVGRPAALKLRAAHVSGWLQLALALGAFAEVARRAVFGSAPEPPAMVGIALVALTANAVCLVLVFRHRHGGAHMKASYIFTANDVLGNLGVIGAGLLVGWTASRVPDLAVGSAIAAIVLVGAVRILRLR